jgi:hypothetical protein
MSAENNALTDDEKKVIERLKEYYDEYAVFTPGELAANDLMANTETVDGTTVRFRSYTPNKDGKYIVCYNIL